MDGALDRKGSLYGGIASLHKFSECKIFQYHIDSFHWEGTERVSFFCLEIVFHYTAKREIGALHFLSIRVRRMTGSEVEVPDPKKHSLTHVNS